MPAISTAEANAKRNFYHYMHLARITLIGCQHYLPVPVQLDFGCKGTYECDAADFPELRTMAGHFCPL
ncbi:hypothetical protein BaRGS_00011813 [Batillaria attramentaria]|uniref:Uncharacterized protein n=1 Tax=Batillaria attramentaria TaxID=370345 RepID=A0ABD0LC64_9CAEN